MNPPADLNELLRHLEEEITDLELLVEMMALALTKDEMPFAQRLLLERILT